MQVVSFPGKTKVRKSGRAILSMSRFVTRRPMLGGRLAGPGGHYNLGNGLGLIGGMMLAVAAVAAGGGLTLQSGLSAVGHHLAGNLGALTISAAMLVFFWGGEHYHQAWAQGFPPLAKRNRQGDLWSGYGALILGLGLFLTGQPLLAATSGLMHAAGKFASAGLPSRAIRIFGVRIDLFRGTVLLSRLPALALVVMEGARIITQTGPAQPLALASPVLLFACYLIWARADVMLFRAE